MKSSQPWLYSAAFDLVFILSPALLISALALVFQEGIARFDAVPPWMWLVLVVGVDVSHVYSTLFRTYFDKREWRQRQALYTLVPLGAWLGGCLLYSIDSMIFWRVLAYLAVFHFVRQQYGLMMIYGRDERNLPASYKHLDRAAIYLATLYPLVYWHTHERQFHWFIAGDFIKLDAPEYAWLAALAASVYLAVMAAYVVKEIMLWKKFKHCNLPRNLLLIGTAAAWFIGIVAFDNDIAFTATNILAHGIPYLALIWVYGRNHSARNKDSPSPFISAWIATIFKPKAVALYVGALASLAYVEEGIWDSLVWRNHTELFWLFSALPPLTSETALVWLIPLLALPQATHYLLDAYIWRLKSADTEWKEILFFNMAQNTNNQQKVLKI